VRTLMLTLQAR